MKTTCFDQAGVARFIALMLLVVGCVSCKSGEGPVLGGETNWLAWCKSDAECDSGTCVCGVCSTACDGGQPSCAAGPADSSCFARGSFAHSALCGEDSAEGVCLPACATDSDCDEGRVCQFGACSPGDAAPGASTAAPASPDEARQSALSSFTNVWFEAFSVLPQPVNPAFSCSECPTLEQLLSDNENDACYSVKAGCGLYYVGIPGALSGTHYWYERFGAPPVAELSYSDTGGGSGLRTSRSLDCDAIESMCSTCGLFEPSCEDVRGAFPEPPPTPTPVAGCSCEPEDEGAARVSLECFCSLHDCPSSVEVAAASCNELGAYAMAGTDACGQIWVEQNYSNRLRFVFDAASGALVSAVANTGAPVTAPCSSFRVVAGATGECPITDACDCFQGGVGSCASSAWFGSLLP